jgi:hypothetical protein
MNKGMQLVKKLLLISVGLLLAFCTPKNDQELKPLFEAVIPAYLLAGENIVWVIEESDTASNRTMFGMEICSAEFFQRSLFGENRMTFDGREAKISIWDCLSTCLSEPKAFRFIEEHFPEGIELVSQNRLDSLQKVVDSKVLGDSVRREAFREIQGKSIYRFSKPVFFGGGNFALLYYSNASVNEGYLVFEKKEKTWVKVHQQVYQDFENDFVVPEFIF